MELTPQIEGARRDWADALGAANVLYEAEHLERVVQNITEYPARTIVAVLRPATGAQVREVVAIANRHAIGLYPLATGKNWGYGSRLPVRDGCAIVDLRRMDRIVEVDERLRYAILEPGVTQQQLADYLLAQHPSLCANVTGAGKQTSIVGNLLERGLGALGSRYRDLLGLEVVLGTGALVRTGHWHYRDLCREASSREAGRSPLIHPPGVGPDLNGLFTQSNLGLVTAAAVRLYPRMERVLLWVQVAEANLPQAIEELFALREEALLSECVNITSAYAPAPDDTTDDTARDNTTDDSCNDDGADGVVRVWMILGSWSGTGDMPPSMREAIERRLAPLSTALAFATSEQPGDIEFFEHFASLYRGQPSDRSLQVLASLGGVEFDEQTFSLDEEREIPGFVCVSPTIPFHGEWVRRTIATIDAVSEQLCEQLSEELSEELSGDSEVTPVYSLVGVGPTALAGVVRAFFDRSDADEIARAHEWAMRVQRALADLGIYVHRSSVQHMDLLAGPSEDSYWETIERIAKAFDPNGIIAPGRYRGDRQ